MHVLTRTWFCFGLFKWFKVYRNTEYVEHIYAYMHVYVIVIISIKPIK